VGVYRKPGGRAFARFGARNANGVRTVFAGVDAVLGARCRAAWFRVLLPMKPNGSTGYVRATRVKVRIVRSRVVIDLSSRRVAEYDSGRLALTTTAAIGAPATPTPLGRLYINQRFRDDPNGPYGWAAIGISAFSEVLTGWPKAAPSRSMGRTVRRCSVSASRTAAFASRTRQSGESGGSLRPELRF
jgi:hypothetical protein